MPSIFRSERPDLFVPIDYRFFNMRAARAARAMRIPVVYFFAPVSWFGSGNKRFIELAETVDLALLPLPLSLNEYREAGVNFEFIGHPIMDTARAEMNTLEAINFFGAEPGRITIGLMPGSRFQEIARLLPVFVRAIPMILDRVPNAQFLLFRATQALEPTIKKFLRDAPVKIVHEKLYEFMNLCDVLILCSGTATHEATILEKPMIATYMLSRPTAWLARKTMNPPFVALPNIIANEFVVPELIQEDCTPQAIAQKTADILSDSDLRCKMKHGLARVKAELGEPGALARAAKRVVQAAIGDIPDILNS